MDPSAAADDRGPALAKDVPALHHLAAIYVVPSAVVANRRPSADDGTPTPS